MNNRTRCRCGCGASIAQRRLGTVWATEACRKRFERDSASQNADTTRTRSPHPGGLQVSYRKAVEVVAYELASMLRAHLGYDGTNEYPRARAERVLAEALSERQRERVQR